LVPALGLAQLSGFNLSGTILDESGAVLPGATLTLSNQNTGITRTVSSNASGRYSFASVPAGTYSLRVELQGFTTAEFADLQYFANTGPSLNVTLQVGGVTEQVTVTAERPLVNTSQAQIGQTVVQRQIAELPLESRNYLDLVTIANGIVAANSDVVLGSIGQNVNGTYIRYTNYQLDGFNNTRDQHGVAKVDLGLDSVEEFRVITNQFSAEYGQSMAGIISATTKTGGNNFAGTGYAFFRPGSLDSPDPLTGAETSLDRQNVGFTASGPIAKDKTHFFVSYEYVNQSEDAVVTATIADGAFEGVFPLKTNRSLFLAKVGEQFNDVHNLSAKFFWNDETIQTGVGGNSIEDNKRDNFNRDLGFQGILTSVFGSNWVNEFRFGFIDENYESVAPVALESGAPVLNYPGQGTIGSSNQFQSANEEQWEFSDTVSVLRGDHSLKFGFDFYNISTIADLQVFWNGQYNFAGGAPFPYDPNNPASFPTLYLQGWFGPDAPTVLERSEAHIQTYVQDDWQATQHLTLNLGFRWEKETSVPDNNNFAPRFGFNWDASKDGLTSVRGGFGIFYNYIFSAIESFEIFTGPEGFFVAALAPDDPFFPQFPNSLPGPNVPRELPLPPGDKYMDAAQLSPSKRNSPFSKQFTLGVERQFGPSWGASVDVTYIHGQHLILPHDVNAPEFFDYSFGDTRSSREADATRPFGVPGTPIPAGASPWIEKDFPFDGYRQLKLLDSRGSSQYWAVKARANKRYADNFMLQFIYTWSQIRNDGDSFRDGSFANDPNDRDAEWGRGNVDIPLQLVINGIYDAPYGIRLSGIARVRSGRTVNPAVGSDRNGDRESNERAFSNGEILDRNSFRMDAFFTWDMSFSKIFSFAETQSMEIRADVFNITNHLNPNGASSTYGPDALNPLAGFLRTTQALAGRQWQFSARYRF
jgi:hypothetical protein